MGKSLKITESQLKRLLKSTINEQRQHKSIPVKNGLRMMDMVNEQTQLPNAGNPYDKSYGSQQTNKFSGFGGGKARKGSGGGGTWGDEEIKTPADTQQPVQDKKSVTLQIQNKLIAQHYLYTKPTGFYGPKTKEAVKDWQLANQGKGLKSDGYFIKGRDDKALGVDMGSVPRLFYQPPVQKTAPIQKTVPNRNSGNEYNDAAMRGISNTNQRTLKTPQVSLRQPAPDTISTDYRNRQGNY